MKNLFLEKFAKNSTFLDIKNLFFIFNFIIL
jgi:hypothetical protein